MSRARLLGANETPLASTESGFQLASTFTFISKLRQARNRFCSDIKEAIYQRDLGGSNPKLHGR
jgi:hypothetical protein